MKLDLQKIFFLFSLLAVVTLPSCVDLEYDEPDTSGTPLTIEANTTIQDLKNLYIPGSPTVIEEEVIIRGIVTANDRSGNLYRTFYLQDSTAGVEVQVALTSSYNFYLVGRELAIDCQGLVLGEYNGVIYLGGYLYGEGGASQTGLIVDYNERIYRGELVGAPAPAVKSINQLVTNDIGRLIQLDDVEFALDELNMTYSDVIGQQTLNRTIVDCNGNEIELRTSGYADFAGEIVASGNGTAVGIYTVYRDTRQLYIRDLNDIMMDSTRCDGSGGTGEVTLMTIKELRDAFAEGTTSGPAAKKIRGVVISDRDNGNINGLNMVIQDATAGILVRFQDDHNFNLNEEVEVIVSGQELSEYNGLLQVNYIPNTLATSMGAGTAPTPKAVTIQEILDDFESYESTLVSIEGASISGNATFSGNTTVTDASGSIGMYTAFGASFANSAVPGEQVTLTAIVSEFNDPQLNMRNITDAGGEIMEVELNNLMEVREYFETGASIVPNNTTITGVVISDRDNLNTHPQNIIIQDESGGLVVRFDGEHNFSYGEEVEIVVDGQELSEYNGLFQVNNVPLSNATSLGNGTLPTPRQATVEEIIANLEDWESTVVEITDVAFAQSGVFEGNSTLTLQDQTGQLGAYIRTQASFAGSSLPSGTFALTSIVSQFGDPQLTIRSLNDIQQ
ncbi:MAG: DUF5689 domain-containing protein [Chitinophagales bacterium]|nr:DUF5689 domain-containing protein [Chitinophagales bacterium]